MNKNVLAHKSYSFIILNLILFILFLFLSILTIIYGIKEEDTTIFLMTMIFLGLCCLLFCVTIKTIMKPKVAIEYDDSGIYFHHSKNKTTYILTKDILSVVGNPMTGKGIQYNFGKLIIETKTKKFSFGVIKNVKIVEDFIKKRIMWRYKRIK